MCGTKVMDDASFTYVSRGGIKLEAALHAFGMSVQGATCADLGCSTGGFTDCLLKHGAQHVYAVDTAYGELAWTLRQSPQVTVLERSNALHLEPAAACDLVAIDLGWTPQSRALPVALRWLAPDRPGRVITLIKPHYEASKDAMGRGRHGKLDDEQALAVKDRVIQEIQSNDSLKVLGCIPSPIRGGKGGNLEYLAGIEVA